MAEDIQRVRETTTQAGDSTQRTTETSNSKDKGAHQTSVAARLVWYVAGLIMAVLGLRFIFTLLGANTSNGIANFIYNVSHPFVAPFFSLFNYQKYTYGTSHFEIYTLVAIGVYALIAYGIAKLITITQD